MWQKQQNPVGINPQGFVLHKNRWIQRMEFWLPVCNPFHNRSLSPAVNLSPSISKGYQRSSRLPMEWKKRWITFPNSLSVYLSANSRGDGKTIYNFLISLADDRLAFSPFTLLSFYIPSLPERVIYDHRLNMTQFPRKIMIVREHSLCFFSL